MKIDVPLLPPLSATEPAVMSAASSTFQKKRVRFPSDQSAGEMVVQPAGAVGVVTTSCHPMMARSPAAAPERLSVKAPTGTSW